MTKDTPSRDGREITTPRAGSRRRVLLFAAVLATSVVVAVGYAVNVARRADAVAAASSTVPIARVNELPQAGAEPSPEGVAARPYLLFRSTALGESYGRVSLAYLDAKRMDIAPGGERLVTPLQCDRVHYAGDHGICLEVKRAALTTYEAHIFDRNFKILHTLPLAGPPSRARMSPDGRLAAVTVFVSGHSYGSPGFTTRTSVIDAASGRFLIDDLEKLEVLRDGSSFKATDFNFWGVTFARTGAEFYATLGTGGKTLLVQGDLAERRMRVVRGDVECPSLSPDNTQVAFKRRVAMDTGGHVGWRLVVLDLASGRETELTAETRSVDDQVEWLGSQEIVYALPADPLRSSAATNSWALAIDGASPPRLLLPFAFSPTVVR